ncbi:hypothetical protein KFK09_022583 [Dendrobium nobile]|uniref:Ubiquitin-like protease family profile domain-containing protein n=1 Tax=Dendrobium nobile TaxID=94219 RepID=A0A8T3AIX6_DENNO|nr:hypothetical protein KFK09_022583 [Dendrobium nobile]
MHVWFLEHTSIHIPKYPDRRPRFLRWSDDIVYNTEKTAKLFVNLKRRQIFVDIQGVTPEESDLLARMRKNFEQIVRRVDLIEEKLQHCIVQGIIKPDLQAAPSSSSFIPHTIPSPNNIRISSEHTKTDAPEKMNDVEMTQAAERVSKKKKLERKSSQKKIKKQKRVHHIPEETAQEVTTKEPPKEAAKEEPPEEEHGYPASPTVNYRGVEILSPVQEVFLRENIKKYLDTMRVFSSGNVMISRRMIDEILSDSYLDNDHIDAFVILLNEKSKISPDEYQKYLYISPMYWHYKVKDVKSVLFLEHIDYNSIQSSSIIINPIIHGNHWTLLAGYIKQKRWKFYDSIPNPMHRSIAVKIIASINKDCKKAFRQNINKWSFKTMKKAPTQTNNTDCCMFICKYMENIVRQNNSSWMQRTDWQEKMPKYRAEFAYGLFCAAMK